MNDDSTDAATYTYKMADRYLISNNSIKNPVLVNTVTPNYNITFHNTVEGKQIEVGKMDFNGGVLKFHGAAEPSAKVFIDYVSRQFTGRLAEERVAAAKSLVNLCEVVLEEGRESDSAYRKAFSDGVATCRLILMARIKELEGGV